MIEGAAMTGQGSGMGPEAGLRHRHLEAVLARAEPLAALMTAVVCPEEATALGGALLARQHSILDLILIGDPARIRANAAAMGADLTGIEIVAAAGQEAAAQTAVDMVHAGRVQAVVKGHLHTDVFLRPMLDRVGGLRVGRRFTHVFVLDVPGLPHPLLVTDAAINIAPDLTTKVDIVQNAIDLAVALGIAVPRVAILSAVATVNPAIPSSIDAALLAKMAERGQIRGGIYVTSDIRAVGALRAARARLVFCGHVHVPALCAADMAGAVRAQHVKSGVAVPLIASRRWLTVVGSAGQPRDRNPAAAYAIWDAATAEFTFRRVPYDCGKTASKLRAAGLPEALALRLLTGD